MTWVQLGACGAVAAAGVWSLVFALRLAWVTAVDKGWERARDQLGGEVARLSLEAVQLREQLAAAQASPWARLGEAMRGELAEVGVWRTQGGDWYCVLWQDGRQARARVEVLAADSADEALASAFRKLAASLVSKSSAAGQPM